MLCKQVVKVLKAKFAEALFSRYPMFVKALVSLISDKKMY